MVWFLGEPCNAGRKLPNPGLGLGFLSRRVGGFGVVLVWISRLCVLGLRGGAVFFGIEDLILSAAGMAASMAGAPRVRSLNVAETDADARPVLVPGGNKARSGPAAARKPSPKPLRKADTAAAAEKVAADAEVVAPATPEAGKRRCAWVTPTSDPCYVIFHDEEWGVPVHDDRRLFELLVLSGALAELTWPEILKRRQLFREIFVDFDPVAISKINEKKLVAPGSVANSLLSEQKLRAVVENARQILKIVDEFGSFDRYCWGFLNHKPIVSKFRYPRQVPVKSPKADMISKDMVRRGFRGVGPTIIYSFMQAAGLTNDHLVSCFRFKECNEAPTLCTSDTSNANSEADLSADELRTKICSKEMAAKAELLRTIGTLIIS